MMKCRVINAFSSEMSGDNPCQILVATETAKCEISSDDCRLALRSDFPKTMESLVQEAGRVARRRFDDGINDTYHIFASVSGIVDLVKLMQDDSITQSNEHSEREKKRIDAVKRQKQVELNKLLEVIKFLVLRP